MDKFYTEMQFLEEEAHRHAFKDPLGGILLEEIFNLREYL